MVSKQDSKLAQETAEMVVSFLRTKQLVAQLLDVQYEENNISPFLSTWVATIMVREQEGQAVWETTDGRQAYARVISVPIQPVERVLLSAAPYADKVIETYRQIMFTPPPQESSTTGE